MDYKFTLAIEVANAINIIETSDFVILEYNFHSYPSNSYYFNKENFKDSSATLVS